MPTPANKSSATGHLAAVASANYTYPYGEILVSPSWACNLRCKYCFIDKNKVTKTEEKMSVEMAEQVIDALDEGLSDVKVICVHLYGGEPFLNLEAAEAMIKRAHQKQPGRFTFSATTNGTVLSDRVIDILNEGKFSLVLSIDGPAEIHDECRKKVNGSPSHADVMRFLEAVRTRTSCHVCGSSVVRSGWGLLKAYDYLSSLPIDAIKAQGVRLPDGAPYALSLEEKEVYKKDLETIGQRVIKDLEENRVPLDRRFAPRVIQLLHGVKREIFCGAGLYNFGITPSGVVLPCLLLEESQYVLGHINDDPSIWRNAGKEWKATPLRESCKSCKHVDVCGGGCPAMLSVCSEDECEMSSKSCDVVMSIYEHFKRTNNLEALLGFLGILE